MTSDEKRAHRWHCDLSRGDVQCPFVTQHGSGVLCCCWRAGHPPSLLHADTFTDAYNDFPNFEDRRIWRRYRVTLRICDLCTWPQGAVFAKAEIFGELVHCRIGYNASIGI